MQNSLSFSAPTIGVAFISHTNRVHCIKRALPAVAHGQEERRLLVVVADPHEPRVAACDAVAHLGVAEIGSEVKRRVPELVLRREGAFGLVDDGNEALDHGHLAVGDGYVQRRVAGARDLRGVQSFIPFV